MSHALQQLTLVMAANLTSLFIRLMHEQCADLSRDPVNLFLWLVTQLPIRSQSPNRRSHREWGEAWRRLLVHLIISPTPASGFNIIISIKILVALLHHQSCIPSKSNAVCWVIVLKVARKKASKTWSGLCQNLSYRILNTFKPQSIWHVSQLQLKMLRTQPRLRPGMHDCKRLRFNGQLISCTKHTEFPHFVSMGLDVGWTIRAHATITFHFGLQNSSKQRSIRFEKRMT